MIWYKPGLASESCISIRLSTGREKLLCYGLMSAQGIVDFVIYWIDPNNPRGNLMAGDGKDNIVAITNNVHACSFSLHENLNPKPLLHSYFDKIEILTSPAGLELHAMAATGLRPMTPAAVEDCLRRKHNSPSWRNLYFPATQSHHLVFRFNGQTFLPTPATTKALRHFTSPDRRQPSSHPLQ